MSCQSELYVFSNDLQLNDRTLSNIAIEANMIRGKTFRKTSSKTNLRFEMFNLKDTSNQI